MHLVPRERASKEDFPQEFGLGDNVQKHITCFETLAQTGLVFAAQFGPNVAQRDVIIPSLDDKQPSESAISRPFTTSRPLCYFIQALAALAAELRIKLVASHMPGKDNVWTDGLSRFFPEISENLDLAKRIRCPPALIGLEPRCAL